MAGISGAPVTNAAAHDKEERVLKHITILAALAAAWVSASLSAVPMLGLPLACAAAVLTGFA